MTEIDTRSWWRRIFGRSLIKAVFGDFFDNKRTTASLLALMLVATVCYEVVWKDKDYLNQLMNIIFVIIGYYFGSKSGKSDEEDEGP